MRQKTKSISSTQHKTLEQLVEDGFEYYTKSNAPPACDWTPEEIGADFQNDFFDRLEQTKRSSKHCAGPSKNIEQLPVKFNRSLMNRPLADEAIDELVQAFHASHLRDRSKDIAVDVEQEEICHNFRSFSLM